jgi:ParB family protein of integrating conjugative element (PFGI_1 class)
MTMKSQFTTEHLERQYKLEQAKLARSQGLPSPLSPEELAAESVIELNVYEIEAFDKNPRIHDNTEYEIIKQSIAARGLESKLFVTRRPGSTTYMLAKGGRTRLKILRELAQSQPQFKHQLCIQVPYQSESDLVAAHLVENIQHGRMCFWDISFGIRSLQHEIEHELGKKLSSILLLRALKDRGLEVDRNSFAAGNFSLDFLSKIGPWQADLKMFHVKELIQPLYERLQASWKKQGKSEFEFQGAIDEALTSCIQSNSEYSPAAICESMTSRIEPSSLEVLSLNDPDRLGDSQESIGSISSLNALGSEPSDSTPQAQSLRAQTIPVPASRGNRTSIQGVIVASSDQVRTLPPKVRQGRLNEQELAFVKSKSPLWIARQAFQDELIEFCRVAALDHLVTLTDSPHLPYGAYLELPRVTIGLGPQELSVQAWWFLIDLLGQQKDEVILEDQNARAAGAIPVFATDSSYAQIFQSVEAEEKAIISLLGGQAIDPYRILCLILKFESHPLRSPLLKLLLTVGDLDLKLRDEGIVT